jgi:hypothetical protein
VTGPGPGEAMPPSAEVRTCLAHVGEPVASANATPHGTPPPFFGLPYRSKRPKRPHEAQSPGIVDFEASDASKNRSVRLRPKRPQASAPSWPPEGVPRPASRGGPDRLTCRVDLVPPAGGGDLASAIGGGPWDLPGREPSERPPGASSWPPEKLGMMRRPEEPSGPVLPGFVGPFGGCSMTTNDDLRRAGGGGGSEGRGG